MGTSPTPRIDPGYLRSQACVCLGSGARRISPQQANKPRTLPRILSAFAFKKIIEFLRSSYAAYGSTDDTRISGFGICRISATEAMPPNASDIHTPASREVPYPVPNTTIHFCFVDLGMN
mgnify:CR=1 FL=1